MALTKFEIQDHVVIDPDANVVIIPLWRLKRGEVEVRLSGVNIAHHLHAITPVDLERLCSRFRVEDGAEQLIEIRTEIQNVIAHLRQYNQSAAMEKRINDVLARLG